jgi:hypothetical protein
MIGIISSSTDYIVIARAFASESVSSIEIVPFSAYYYVVSKTNTVKLGCFVMEAILDRVPK